MTSVTLAEAGRKAATLVEALPYIRGYRGSRVVVKIGGEALDDPDRGRTVAEDIALMALVGIDLVIVHGGGPQITRAMDAAGIESRFVDGLRITDPATIEIVSQVLTGSITPALVTRLNQAGARAVGLSGVDGALLRAEPLDPRLGRVGRVTEVSQQILERLVADGYTPVVASLAPGPDGEPMNVNADEAAGAVAAALGASKLVYLTNVEGLYRDFGDAGSLTSEISSTDLEDLLPMLSAGMKPKAASAIAALNSGVGKVHILDGRVPHALLLEVFTDEGIGTQVVG